jgi:hypothetical protein
MNVKEHVARSGEIIKGLINGNAILCEKCLRPMKRHSSYERGIKETGQKIVITMVWCSACKKYDALLPDFLLPGKHYGGTEIESVIIDSATDPVEEIETEASEGTVRRWIKQIGEKIRRACGILKYQYKRAGKAISELEIEPGSVYSELEQILEKAPAAIKYSGNKLGLANLWLGRHEIRAYI